MPMLEERSRLFNEMVSDWNSLMTIAGGKFKDADFPPGDRVLMAGIMKRLATRIEQHDKVLVSSGSGANQ